MRSIINRTDSFYTEKVIFDKIHEFLTKNDELSMKNVKADIYMKKDFSFRLKTVISGHTALFSRSKGNKFNINL